MYDVLAKFEEGSKEYDEMMYRITCMQGYQQEIIDSIKGIIPKKVPRYWHDFKCLIVDEDDSDEVKEWKLYNQKLVANKKPYFFIYNYQHIMRKYKKYLDNCNTNCLIRFGLTVEQLREEENKTDEQKEFIKYYDLRMPVSMEKSLMNRLCWAVENEFEDINAKLKNEKFDPSFLKCGEKYGKKLKSEIENIYKDYKRDAKNNMSNMNNFQDSHEANNSKAVFVREYEEKFYSACNDRKVLCDILIDICYNNNNSKQLVWDMVGDVIVDNLLKQNNYEINIPYVAKDKTNTIWQGKYYDIRKHKLKEEK